MKPITIIGGGLAGLTLGIALRRAGVPVTVCEAGAYPRHRVCGEFISGQGQKALARLGLRDLLVEAGAAQARTAAFFVGDSRSPVRALPIPALCLSRFDLDALLAKEFQDIGGELRLKERCVDISGEGIVAASGRRLQSRDRGWRWFGLKIHARKVDLIADLEMHGSADGYVGITRLNADIVNVCGLFRRREGEKSHTWVALLRGRPGTALRARMGAADFDDASFCSVAGLSLRARRAFGCPECCVGDALTMTPPVTGNGMSMAFEAAELAAGPLAAFSRAEFRWEQARQKIAQACDMAFGRRLAWARWLQWMMFAPALQGSLGAAALRSELLWRTMFAKTR